MGPVTVRLRKMKTTFVMITSAGPNRDLAKTTREQPFWDEHAEFIDRLVAEGFIWMGGPLVDEGGSLLFFHAADEISRFSARENCDPCDDFNRCE